MRSPEERFWSKVSKSVDGCWVWRGSISAKGYGTFRPDTTGRVWKAHRYSYAMAHPDVLLTKDVLLMHSCDNRLCVNVDHLSIGTNAENTRDRVAKNRSRKPGMKKSGHSDLTWGIVRNIRANYTGKRGELKYLCALHGVSKSSMLKMLAGDTWKEEKPFEDQD